MTNMYRQGDILFIECSEVSDDSIEVKNNKVIIQSPITGHTHSITSGKLFFRNLVRFDENDSWNDLNSKGVIGFVEANDKTKVIHQEHKEIALPSGIYEIRRQKEVGGFVND